MDRVEAVALEVLPVQVLLELLTFAGPGPLPERTYKTKGLVQDRVNLKDDKGNGVNYFFHNDEFLGLLGTCVPQSRVHR